MTSGYHGSKISGAQRRPFALLNAGIKVLASVLFLSAILHRKVIHVIFISAIFAGPRFFEIPTFCYHGNVT